MKTFINIALSAVISAVIFSCSGNSEDNNLRVLQFNVWQEGTIIDGGFEGIVNEILATDADLVAISEVRNYNNTRFCDRLTKALKDKGETYYSFFSHDTGVLSRTPIEDSVEVYPWHNSTDAGSIQRLLTTVNGQKLAFYASHLDYRNCAYYDVRGYDGSSWQERKPIDNVKKILKINRKSKRDNAIKKFIKAAQKDIDAGRVVIMAGDYNEPSHLDWTEQTKDIRDHNGLVVEWDVSKLLEQAGYSDAYRVLYPNPVTHPGFTYPANTQGAEINKLTWAPKADERERIDFIHYYPNPSLKLIDITVLAPLGDIYRATRDTTPTEDPLRLPAGAWPTDHKALLATFTLK